MVYHWHKISNIWGEGIMRVFDNGIFRDMTAEELEKYERSTELTVEEKIADLKQKLADTDYKAIKYAEGFISEEEYEPIKLERQEWREEINRLESE